MKIFKMIIFAVGIFLMGCSSKPVNFDSYGTDIIAFGDSLTYGHGASEGESYPAWLASFTGKEIINLGASGDTSAQGVSRLKGLSKYNPKMVLVEFGANDKFRNLPLSQTEENISAIIEYVQGLGAIVVLLDTGGAWQMDKYTKMNKNLSKKYGTLFVSGIMDDIFTDNKLKSDTVHPNGEGYKIIAKRVENVISPYIN